MNLTNLLDEIEYKLEALPESYFMNYLEQTFIPKLKEINKKLNKKLSIQADSLREAEFINEIKRII